MEMEYRTCKKCDIQRPIDRFATFKGRDGIMHPRGTCWDCRDAKHRYSAEILKAYRKNYNQAKRSEKREKDYKRRMEGKAFVDALKENPCVDCGHRFHPVAMDFDHVRGSKVRSIASMVSSAIKPELIKEEIAKCELVCACCHRIRTHVRKENLSPHVPIGGIPTK